MTTSNITSAFTLATALKTANINNIPWTTISAQTAQTVLTDGDINANIITKNTVTDWNDGNYIDYNRWQNNQWFNGQWLNNSIGQYYYIIESIHNIPYYITLTEGLMLYATDTETLYIYRHGYFDIVYVYNKQYTAETNNLTDENSLLLLYFF